MQFRSLTFACALLVSFATASSAGAGTIWVSQAGAGSVDQFTMDGTFRMLVFGGLSKPTGIAADNAAKKLYWADYTDGTIRSCNFDGSGMITLASGQPTAFGLAIDATHAYWTRYGDGVVNSVPLAGGTLSTYAIGRPGPRGISCNGSTVVWAEDLAGDVVSIPTAGAPSPTILASSLSSPSGVATAATFAYWGAGGKIQHAFLGGGPSSDDLTGLGDVTAMTLNAAATTAYWVDGTAGTLETGTLGGTAHTVLAAGLDTPSGIALVDDPSLVGTPDSCEAKKLSALAKAEAGLLGCTAKAAAKGDPASMTNCNAAVRTKFEAAFAKVGTCDGIQSNCEAIGDVCNGALLAALPDGNSPPVASKCEAARLKAASKKAAGLLKCASKAVKSGDPIDVDVCVAKVNAKFDEAFTKVSGCTGDGVGFAIAALINAKCASLPLRFDVGAHVTTICP